MKKLIPVKHLPLIFLALGILPCVPACFSQQGHDVELNPEKYLNKKVSLIAQIEGKPCQCPEDRGKYFDVTTYKYVRGDYGKNVLTNDGKRVIPVFVPNDKVDSFIRKYKDEPKPLRGTLMELTAEELTAIMKATKEKLGRSETVTRFYINTQKDSE